MQLTPEKRFLSRCVRAVLYEEPVAHDEFPRLSWADVSADAKRHQVAPLVYEVIQGPDLEHRIPQEVRSELLLEYHRTGMRNEFIHQRVAEILAEAERKGVEVMLLKGAVLLRSGYSRLEHRTLGDVDLLVRERDFRGLREALEGLGYQSAVPDLCDADLPRYAQCVEQVRFASQRIPPVEVHFRLVNMGVAAAEEPAWHDAEPMDFDGLTVRRPSPERFLLHLCLHAQQHAFAVLRLLVDIAVWHRAHPLDTDRFVALARRYHLATPAFYALTYTADMIGLPESELTRTLLRPTKWKRRRFEYLWRDRKIRCLQSTLGSRESELPRAYLLGDAPLSQRAAFLWSVLMPPGRWFDSGKLACVADAGSIARRRLQHLGRVLGGAWKGILGTAGRKR